MPRQDVKLPRGILKYVIKGGKVRFTMPDGSVRDVELKTGDTLLRPPVTHTDEALDDLEVGLVELKK